MSLINDALKRAQKAQAQTPPPAQPAADLRPAEPVSYAWHGIGLLLPAALALVALLTLFLVWEMARQRTNVEVRAATPPQATSPTPAQASDHAVDAAPAQITPPPRNTAPPTTTSSPTATAVGTNAPASDDTAKPSAPKLQAVIYNPRNPSAVINGRTVFRGDRVGPFRVVTITADSATLVGEGQTNRLSLEH